MSGGFQRTDHTADEGLRVYGQNPKELFQEAAKGMVSILVDLNTVHAEETHILELQAESVEELLIFWLREILYLMEQKKMLFCQFQIENDNISLRNNEMVQIRAFLRGEKLNPSRHEICKEIKSVTRHGLYVKKGNPWWEANILFDV